MNDQERFYKIAKAAMEAGVLTRGEVVIITRPGTRKYGYWGRHLRDLCEVLLERKLPDGIIELVNEARRTFPTLENEEEKWQASISQKEYCMQKESSPEASQIQSRSGSSSEIT